MMEICKIKKLRTEIIWIQTPIQFTQREKFIIPAAGIIIGFLTGGLWALPVAICLLIAGKILCSNYKRQIPVSQIIVELLESDQQMDLIAKICRCLNTITVPTPADFAINVARNPDQVKTVASTVISFVKSQPQISCANAEEMR